MDAEPLLGTILDFALALLIGALAGIEREKRKEAEAGPTIGGIRTFMLIALVGAVSAWLARGLDAAWILAVGLAAVASLVLGGYVLAAKARPASLGVTTEVAALAVFLLAAMTLLGHRELAVALGIVTALLLAYKAPLHVLVERLGWDDIYAGLRFLVASFVVLPLLPDRPLDPLGALNPYSLWLLVVLISGLSLVGYVGARALGERRGVVLTALTGGLVSSTAVTLTFAKRSREADSGGGAGGLAAGVLLAWCVMFARVAVEVLVVCPSLLPPLLVPLAAMALGACTGAVWLFRRSTPRAEPAGNVPLKNPFRLTEAAKFAGLFAAVLVFVKLAERVAPGEGAVAVAALAGLTDVDAITLSMAKYAREGGAVGVAVTAITVAALTNTLVKAGMVVALGSAGLRRRLVPATLVVLGLGAVALALA